VDFALSDEQALLRDTARKLLARESPRARVRAAIETEAGFDRALWEGMAELGWVGMLVPEELGGAGLDFTALEPMLEELGRALVPSPFFAHLLGTLALMRTAGLESRQRWLPEVARGERILTLAVTETAGREHPDLLALRAESSGGAWRLRGHKLFVPDAQSAHAIVVLARDANGLAWFLVERGAAGLAISPLDALDRTRRLAEVRFEDTPAERLDAAHDAWSAWEWIRDRALVALAADALGGAEAALEATVAYVKTRVQFGAPIGANQVIKHRCAELLIDVEATRSLVHHAAWAVAHERADAPLAAAMAKARACATYRRVSADSIQLHGSIGFTWEADCHLYFRRARSLEITFGDAAEQRERVAALLRGRPDDGLV
jgi:alkylation response protein AidB-like acyl-CoA dehydrogenase